jgi:catechol 2,3-dioxygenase-like lactoylglutathione lyase family enzyme
MPLLKSIFTSVIVTLSFTGCSSEAVVDAQTPTPIPGAGGFVALSVANLAASEQWYTQKFGMTVKLRVPKQNGVEVVVLQADRLLVELVSNDAARSLPATDPAVSDRALLHGPFKAGFLVDNFDAAVSTLQGRGASIAFGPFPASSSQNANVIFRDNSGNLLQLIAR